MLCNKSDALGSKKLQCLLPSPGPQLHLLRFSGIIHAMSSSSSLDASSWDQVSCHVCDVKGGNCNMDMHIAGSAVGVLNLCGVQVILHITGA